MKLVNNKICYVDSNGCGQTLSCCFKYAVTGNAIDIFPENGMPIHIVPEECDPPLEMEVAETLLMSAQSLLCHGVPFTPIDPPVMPECCPVSFDLVGGKYLVSDLVALANECSTKEVVFTDLVGFNIAVEKVGGKSFDDTEAETCFVKSFGHLGKKQLDGAGANWTIKPSEDLKPITEQCFEVATGTIAEFNGSFI